ncbi:MAG: hypothetical protein WCW77_04160, partial [Patescibacteria group bacterium]
CSLLLLNGLIFSYLNKSFTGGRKTLYFILAAVLILIFTVAGLRLFSGEDGWICVNGQWVEHGHPRSPMPDSVCGKASGQ